MRSTQPSQQQEEMSPQGGDSGWSRENVQCAAVRRAYCLAWECTRFGTRELVRTG